MTAELPVHISREEVHGLDVPPAIEIDGTFDIRLVNHGKALHVHVHLDDDLSDVADIDAGNHYVEGESERAIPVDVDTDALAELDGPTLIGKVKVASGYGAETRWVDIEARPPEDENDGVEVDESLAKPQSKEPEPSLLEEPEIPVLALGAIALLVAALTALVLEDTLIFAGSLVVLGGVLAALFFLLQSE